MTIYPVSVAGTPMANAAEVLGMMLERGGMANLEIAPVAFQPSDGADLATTADAFAAFVKATPPATEYGLYAEFRGAPQTGVDEVRSIVVSKDGAIVWLDSQTPKDADFARIKPRDPMECCRLVALRLRPVFGLADPFRADAPSGKLARAWEARTGLPNDQERAAIDARTKTFRAAPSTATLAVFRPRAPQGVETSAVELARRIDDAKLMRATPVEQTPAIEVASDMNEQKVLWSMARNFSAYVKQHPPDADYALLADYLGGTTPTGDLRVGAVHLAVCNRAGELVLVDYQNSHQRDFQSIDPKSVQACDALVTKRLASYRR